MAVLLALGSGPLFAYGLTIGPNDVYSLAGGTTDLDCGDLIVEGVLNMDTGTMDSVRAVIIREGGVLNGDSGTINKSGILQNLGTLNEENLQINFISECVDASADRATFTVHKLFEDLNNTTPVTVKIDCNTGLPLIQQQTVVADGNGEFEVEFVVESFDQNEMDCEIFETDVPGYTASYEANSNIGTINSDSASDPAFEGCRFENLLTVGGELVDWQNECVITNTVDYQTVTINKVWILGLAGTSSGGDHWDDGYTLKLICNGEIDGGYEHSGRWSKTFTNASGTNDHSYTALVKPAYPNGTACWVEEHVNDSIVEVTNDCGDSPETADLLIAINQGDSCTVTNTVFFEGIPTLNQYGLAILALLTLGMGFLGFRRLV